MLTLRCVLRFAILGLCVSFAAFGATVPGALNGFFAVGDQGEGTYTIPIAAPAGAGGLTANLVLRYNHLSGNGLAGMRWTLGGLSAITRCPRTYAQDGAPMAVVNAASDRFCLDGARLVEFTGTYGAANTEYRTEIETFRRIVQLGTQAGGPLSFRVDHGNGSSSYYGTTEDSKVGAVGSVVRRWLISYTEDQFGNRINYTYNENTATGETLPIEVAWTQNAAVSTPPYKVSIVYETRPPGDQRFPFDAGGAQWQSTQRIDKIEVTYNGALINRYELTYGTSPPAGTGRSQLASVQVCGPTDCMPATNFTVQNGVAGWAALADTTRPAGGVPLTGDVNGDGRNDMFAVIGGTWHLYRGNNGTLGLDSAVNTGISAATAPDKARILDYNADGASDLLYQVGGTWHVLRMQPFVIPTFADSNTGLSTTTYPYAEVRDFDGDGLRDLIFQNSSGLIWSRNTGGSLAAPVTVGSSISFFGAGAQYAAPDVNGDGRDDVFIVEHAGCTQGPDGDVCTGELLTYLASGNTYVAAHSFGFGTFSNPRAINLNGDGLDDVIYVAGSTWRRRTSLGGSLFTGEIDTGIPSTNASKVFVADYDNDGRQDLIRPEGDYFHVHRSTGTLPSSPTLSIFSPGAGAAGGFGTDISGDGFTDIVRVSGGNWHFHKHSSPLPDVVTAFVDGLGYSVSAGYSSLPNTANYGTTANHGATWPIGARPYVQLFNGARYVVTTETRDTSEPAGEFTHTFHHKYLNSAVDVAGRGWLSFEHHDIEGPDGATTRTVYDQPFPQTGRAHAKFRFLPGSGDPYSRISWEMDISDSLNTYTTTTPHRHFLRSGFTITWIHDQTAPGTVLKQVSESFIHDATYGTVTRIERSLAEQQSPYRTWGSNTTIVPTNFVTSTEWCLGLPTSEVTVNNLPDYTTATRTTTNTYNASDCTLATTTDESETSLAKRRRTTYGYNSFGNVISIAEDSADGTAQDRSTTIAYDAGQQLPASMTVNGVNLTTQFTWNYLFGTRASVSGPDLLTTSWTYDDFGRLKQENSPHQSTAITYGDCPCWPQFSRFFVRAAGNDGSIRHEFFDEQQRTVGSSSTLPHGAEGRMGIVYNQFGQPARVSKPYVSIDPTYWTTYEYETGTRRLLREDAPLSESAPSGAVTSYQYPGMDVWVTNPGNHTTKYLHNGVGQIVQTIDALNGTTSYSYKHFGELGTVTDAEANTTTIQYDARGFKTSLTDPNMGTWAYDTNVYGELTDQRSPVTTAPTWTQTLTYDAAGRIKTRCDVPEGASATACGTDDTTTWTYYLGTAAVQANRGKLDTISGPQSAKKFTYGLPHGLPTQVRHTVFGSFYFYDLTYDSQARLDVLTYPTSTSSYRFKADYDYDSWGHLSAVKDGNTPSLVYYQLDDADALGRELSVTLANGLHEYRDYDRASGHLASIQTDPGIGSSIQNLSFTYDEVGNVLSRTNANIGKTETFTYDNLNRLSTMQVNGLSAVTMAYSAGGRITSRTDLGSYIYTGGCGGGPMAVKSAAGKTYCYDAAGRMTHRNTNEIQWFSYDALKWIYNGTASSTFTYGVDRERIRQIRKTGSTTTATILYIGDLLERDTEGSTTTWRHYVRARERVVAQVNRVDTTNTTQYFHRDHQNSVVEVTSGSGTSVQSLAYDAWGLRRDPSTWAPLPSPFGGTQPTKRGYTGHEHLDNVQLVHMNGRVQDPRLGLFISPDPFVQAPYLSQSLNRYSYVWNNPPTFVDPSGFCTNFEDNVCIQWAMLLSDSFTSAGIGGVESNLTLAASENFALGGFDPSVQVPGPTVIPPVSQQPVLPSTPPQGDSPLPEILPGSGGGSSTGLRDLAAGFEAASAQSMADFQHEQYLSALARQGNEAAASELAAIRRAEMQRMLGLVPMGGATKLLGAWGTTSILGRSFGRLGTVVENPGITIRGFAGSVEQGHAVHAAITRGLSPQLIRDTVANPTVVLQQGGGRYLYLTDQAAVAITREGQVVTAYGQREFLPHVIEVLSVAGMR